MATIYDGPTGAVDFHTPGEARKIIAADQAELDREVAAFIEANPEWRVIEQYTERGPRRELTYSQALAGERSGPDIRICAELVRTESAKGD